MATFLQKLRTVTLGTAHDLLDKAIDLNSPASIRQYLRDLESALDKMKSEQAVQDGQIRTSTREKSELESKIATDKETITKLMASTAPNAKDLVRGKAAIVLQNQTRLTQLTQDIQTQTESSAKLHTTVTNLENRHDLMVARVRDLERLDRDSKAKEAAAKALQNAGSLIDSGASISVDDIESKMRARNDVANAKFDQAIGDTHVNDETNSEDIDALLATLTPVNQ
jgi:phage shock protein A